MIKMGNLMVIGVDCGNYNIKTASSCFVSGYKVVGKNSNFSDKLEYEGQYYALSQQRLKMRLDKADPDFLILLLFGIAKELAKHAMPADVYEVALAVGLPPEHIGHMELKENLRNYYQGEWLFAYNGTEYAIRVTKVFVCPQNFAGTMAYVASDEMHTLKRPDIRRPYDILRKEPESLLIDIGGGTVDIVGLQNGTPIPEYHKSLPEGLIGLYKTVNDDMRSRTGDELSETAINSVLREEPSRISDDEKRLIQVHMRQYTERLLLLLDEHRLPFRGSYNLVMGGGVPVVKKSWQAYEGFGKLDFLDDIRANARGYEEMALEALVR